MGQALIDEKGYDSLKVEYCEQHNYPLLILDKTAILEERIKSFYEV